MKKKKEIIELENGGFQNIMKPESLEIPKIQLKNWQIYKKQKKKVQ